MNSRFFSVSLVLAACASCSVPRSTTSEGLPGRGMASSIAAALQPGVGEQVLVRFDPGVLVGFPAVLEETLTGRGAEVTGGVTKFWSRRKKHFRK